jgi:hypothetical protein
MQFMGWIKDVVDLCIDFSKIRKERKSGSEQQKRKARELFVLKAIAQNEYPDLLHRSYRNLDLLAIIIQSAQIESAGRGNLARAAMEELSPAEEQDFAKRLDDQIKTMGLPHPNDPEYVSNDFKSSTSPTAYQTLLIKILILLFFLFAQGIAHVGGAYPPSSMSRPVAIVGRFSTDNHWPVLGDY